jgi:energy-coupling factor transport system permease protein
MTSPEGAPPRNPTRRSVVLLRPVPGDSVIHRLWAGTKLLIVFVLGVLMTFYPGWVPIALVAVLVGVAAYLAHIPRGVLPSIPGWLWFFLFLGGFTASFAGGAPEFVVGSVTVGLGGVLNFLRITALSIV